MSKYLSLNLMLLAVILPIAGSAEEIYRTVDETGRVIYSDTPPVSTDQQVERIELPESPSNASVKSTVSRNQAIRKRLQEVQKQRDQEHQRYEQRVRRAEAALDKAEARLIDAKQLKDEDRQSLASGKRRIRPEYFERIKKAEVEVEAAKKRLNQVRNSR